MLSITTPARHKKVNCLMIQASRIIFMPVEKRVCMANFSQAINRGVLFSANFLYLIHNYTYIHYIYIYKYNNIIRIIRLAYEVIIS